MRRTKLSVSSILCLLILTTCVFAQNTTLTKEEFNSAIGNGASNAEKFSRRVVSVNKSFSKNQLTATYTSTQEFLLPEKSRWVTVDEKNNAETVRTETIKIGNIEYKKQGESEWITTDLAVKPLNPPKRLTVSTEKLETTDCWEYIVTETTLDGKTVSLYFSYHVFDVKKILYFIEDFYWIGADGLLIKSSSKVSNTIPANVTSQRLITYEYNPKALKIEAPVLKKETK